jgi:hypothetical protein
MPTIAFVRPTDLVESKPKIMAKTPKMTLINQKIAVKTDSMPSTSEAVE